MKFLAAVVALFASSVSANGVPEHMQELPLVDIQADSDMGRALLAKARRVEEKQNQWYGNNANGQNNNYRNQYNFEEQDKWVAGYSIKFQGCHHISQWNGEIGGEEDARIVTKRLVKFRLCPTNYCNSGDTRGCSSSYGEYVVDLNSYMDAYFEAKQSAAQQMNQYDEYNGNQYYQDVDANYQNNMYANQQQDYQQIQQYMECQQVNGGRRLANNNYNANGNNYNGNANNNYNANGYQDQQQQQYYNFQNQYNDYYMGPYCAHQGGAIYLGLFLDDTCTTFADDNGGRDTFMRLTGQYLPYGSSSIVDMECIPCSESNNEAMNDAYNYYQEDVQDADDVLDMCEDIYSRAGKCEDHLPSGTAWRPNNNGCAYMQGIKVVTDDGTVQVAKVKARKTGRATVGLLTVAFVGLSMYVFYLKNKLDTSINLSDE